MSQDNQDGKKRVRPEYIFSIIPVADPSAPSRAVEELTRQGAKVEEGTLLGEIMKTVQESKDLLTAVSQLLSHGVMVGQPMPPESLEETAHNLLADGVRMVFVNLLKTRFQREKEMVEKCPDEATEEGKRCFEEVIKMMKQDYAFIKQAPLLIHMSKLHTLWAVSHGVPLPLNRHVLEKTTGHSVLVGKILMPEQGQAQQSQQGGGLAEALTRLFGKLGQKQNQQNQQGQQG